MPTAIGAVVQYKGHLYRAADDSSAKREDELDTIAIESALALLKKTMPKEVSEIKKELGVEPSAHKASTIAPATLDINGRLYKIVEAGSKGKSAQELFDTSAARALSTLHKMSGKYTGYPELQKLQSGIINDLSTMFNNLRVNPSPEVFNSNVNWLKNVVQYYGNKVQEPNDMFYKALRELTALSVNLSHNAANVQIPKLQHDVSEDEEKHMNEVYFWVVTAAGLFSFTGNVLYILHHLLGG